MKLSTQIYVGVLAVCFGSTFASPVNIDKEESSGVAFMKRQTAICDILSGTSLVGDGDPSAVYLHKQLSEPISCDSANSCTVSESDSESFTVGYQATATLTDWLSGGFDVSKTWTTGNSYTCEAEAGQTVCIWQKIAQTAYTVQNYVGNSCENGATYGDPFVLTSPNKNNAGGGYYCVVGTCRNQGDQYSDDIA